MRPPSHLAQQLARQWQRANWRVQQLLPNRDAWPLRLAIGAPSAAQFEQGSADLRAHLQAWRAVQAQGPGQVLWQERRYQGAAAPLAVPTHWLLAKPSEAIAAMAQYAGTAGRAAQADYLLLQVVLGAVDGQFHPLLLRRLALWRGAPADEVVTAARMALQLAPGCAQGRPLRALAVAGNDSKFFERHAALLTALLDVRFDGAASRAGLSTFLDASADDEHWLLVAPLAPGLLPFARLRLAASDLQATPLPDAHILLVENERCLHQLPRPLPGTIAILGAGRNLAWLAAPWLQVRRVAYWGDIDTWGLALLAQARCHLPQLQALLMDSATFAAHQAHAVAEPHTAGAPAPGLLTPAEAQLDAALRALDKGRLEQEFIPAAAVQHTLHAWLSPGTAQM